MARQHRFQHGAVEPVPRVEQVLEADFRQLAQIEAGIAELQVEIGQAGRPAAEPRRGGKNAADLGQDGRRADTAPALDRADEPALAGHRRRADRDRR